MLLGHPLETTFTSSIAMTRASNMAGLYLSEKGQLARVIQRIVRNSSTAEDLVHDSFVTLIGKEADASIRDQVAYLTRIAQNLALDHRRREARMSSLEEAAIFDLADASPSPETVVADRDALVQTLKILAAMPERTQRAFQMHRLGEMTLAQIAVELSISTAHAGRLVMDGYRRIRDGLRAAGIE